MDNLAGWVDALISSLERAMAHGAFMSLVLGYVVAIGLTQWIKMIPWTSNNKWIIRLTALPFGFGATFLTWPEHAPGQSFRAMMALAVGVSAPWVYQAVTYFLYKKWPGLEHKLSAQPGAPPDV